jgi:hypothetical protein
MIKNREQAMIKQVASALQGSKQAVSAAQDLDWDKTVSALLSACPGDVNLIASLAETIGRACEVVLHVLESHSAAFKPFTADQLAPLLVERLRAVRKAGCTQVMPEVVTFCSHVRNILPLI